MRRIRMLTLAVCALSTAMILELSAVARPQAAQQPPPSQAGPHMPPGRESVEQRVERLSKELDLTQEQRENIRPVIEEQMKQMRALREDSSLTQEQRREKAMAAMKETHEKVEAILNPEQREKLKQHMQQMRDQRSAEHKEAPAKQ